jgi:hypothetical protein
MRPLLLSLLLLLLPADMQASSQTDAALTAVGAVAAR